MFKIKYVNYMAADTLVTQPANWSSGKKNR